GDNIENCRTETDGPSEGTQETIRAVNREIVRRGNLPRTGKVLAGFDSVSAHKVFRVARAHLEHHSRTTRVSEFQNYSTIRRIDLRMNIQLIRQGTRRPHAFFLLRNSNDHRIQSGNEVWDTPPLELGNRRQKLSGVL